ncbi:acyl-CoA dehydrogenase [Herbiconiux sp. VKM Ac-1786]|uniref:acyl-CoA dehydrogenase n=1 Tax=Herbiconiux sp. VKM Ac-1786 TaxID=2783824 RepID=UPI00188D89AD|nr:acyl-CoA dehydrogenase [Herbiconiux sp. VKM Ac-1786]MBF4571616.1 acyl-CoA dehydrogenase [Herbiconiux sp. VKM Ac-1786]
MRQGVTLDDRPEGDAALDVLFAAAVVAGGVADGEAAAAAGGAGRDGAAASGFAGWLARWSAAGGVAPALELARRVGEDAPLPGRGRTAEYFETLATLAAADVAVARVVEPQLDALAILAECPDPVDLAAIGADADSTWGVFAAEGPGVRLTATTTAGAATAAQDARGWTLSGTKPWCSLAGDLSHALVTAHVERPDGGSERRLFAVGLQRGGVVVHPEAWISRGMPTVPSGPVDFDAVPAVPVGAPGWYLERDGFEWGGIGVAACWFGGAVGVARRVLDAAGRRDDDLGALHAGRCATALFAARSALAAAAARIDAGPMAREGARVLAQEVRSLVRGCCDTVLREAGHALGPAPLALDESYAARVADLELYLLQDHGARDELRLGRMLVERARRETDAVASGAVAPDVVASDPVAPGAGGAVR